MTSPRRLLPALLLLTYGCRPDLTEWDGRSRIDGSVDPALRGDGGIDGDGSRTDLDGGTGTDTDGGSHTNRDGGGSLDGGKTGDGGKAGADASGECTPEEFKLDAGKGSVVLLVDRSSAMSSGGVLGHVILAVRDFSEANDDALNLGLWLFPNGSANNVNDCTVPELQVEPAPMQADEITTLIGTQKGYGRSPSGTALTKLAEYVEATPALARPAAAVLITNGAPSCQAAGAADSVQQREAIEGVERLLAQGVRTHVFSYGANATALVSLDQLAELGGTDVARRVQGGSAGIESALDAIAERNGCEFTLPKEVSAEQLQVSVGPVALAPGEVDGWQLAGQHLSLHGTACARLREQPQQGVTVAVSCAK